MDFLDLYLNSSLYFDEEILNHFQEPLPLQETMQVSEQEPIQVSERIGQDDDEEFENLLLDAINWDEYENINNIENEALPRSSSPCLDKAKQIEKEMKFIMESSIFNSSNDSSFDSDLEFMDQIEEIERHLIQRQGDYQIGNANNLFTVLNHDKQYRQKWKAEEHRFTIRFENIDSTFNRMNQQIITLFDQISRFIQNRSNARTKARIVFYHPSFFEYASTQLMYAPEFTRDFLLDTVEGVMQSNKSISLDENFNFWIYIIDVPAGSGCDKIEEDYIFKSKCVKLVINSDNFCAIRAILISKAYLENNKKDMSDFTKIKSPRLDDETAKMVKKCQFEDKPCTFADIEKVETILNINNPIKYDINVIDKVGNIVHESKIRGKSIYIWLRNNHYYSITNISRFFKVKYFCDLCKKGYHTLLSHKCINNCEFCNRQKCPKLDKYFCQFCSKECNNDKCIEIHQEKFCYNAKKCNECDGYKNERHVCIGQKWCKNCKKAVDKLTHQCYVLTEDEKKKKSSESKGLIFFDYEAYQDENKHIPNLVCAQKICNKCLENRKSNCNECKNVQFNDNHSFCEWLFSQEYYTALAHNMKGYDGVFIMNWIYGNKAPSDSNPFVIPNGSKVMYIKFRNVRILDSFSFIPRPLSEFPEAFGITEMKKGFFPHMFNKPENQNYIGKYPDKELYGIKYFSKSKLEEFNKWYDSVSNGLFDFKKEFYEYCWSDVYLLAEGCLKYRKTFTDLFKESKVEPFNEAITIASLCHFIYRKKYLKPGTLPHIAGIQCEKNNSHKANLWLEYLSKKQKIDIQTAINKGEHKIGPYYVDGYDPKSDTVYEFHGCYFHGCPKCFRRETFNQVSQTIMGNIYSRHKKRIDYIKSKCKNLIEIWECEFDSDIKTNIQLKKLSLNSSFQSPLNPRDSLFGGRTNAIKLHYKIKPGEKIYYYDVTSLYPFVQKYCRYPVGHPVKITQNFGNIKEYFGIIKCKVLPPRGLYIPVLPKKINNKLMFPLCSKCAEEQIKKCKHSLKDRCLTGTWITLELQKAIELGYKVLEIYEIWHWDKSEIYDPSTKNGGIFTPYINTFLKLKQEASGFPKYIKTEEEKREFIKRYYEKEGILLDYDNIKKNSAQRTCYKLCLNSMWGRLGMNCDKNQYKLIDNPKDWFQMISDDSIIITQITFLGDDKVQVFYKNIYVEESTETSVAHAAFVTCHARLKLYSELEKIGKRVLYFDTDSIIFNAKYGDYIPVLGDFLGEFTNEVDEDDYIVEFVSAGPKNYAYRTMKNKTECKVKGFKLIHETAQKINFDSIKEIVTTNQEEKIEVDQLRFRRNKRKWEVTCENEKKVYGFVYDKRVLFDDLTTLPFGF